jgi:hypothetical protein
MDAGTKVLLEILREFKKMTPDEYMDLHERAIKEFPQKPPEAIEESFSNNDLPSHLSFKFNSPIFRFSISTEPNAGLDEGLQEAA